MPLFFSGDILILSPEAWELTSGEHWNFFCSINSQVANAASLLYFISIFILAPIGNGSSSENTISNFHLLVLVSYSGIVT